VTVAADLAQLRMLVAAVGERTEPPWWPTQFFSSTGQKWMARVFPRTEFLARLSATTKAAARVHDAAVGGRDRYHLFRLPSDLESALRREATALSDDVSEATLAETLSRLSQLAGEQREGLGVGPILIADADHIGRSTTVRALAATYLGAAESGSRVFPYFEETAG
jgi:CRP-like cAMP-binding protein